MLSSVTCSWYRTEVALQSRGTCGHQTPEPAKPRNKVKGVEASHAVAMPCGRHGCHALRSAVPGSGAACSGAALPSLRGERDPGALGRSGGAPAPRRGPGCASGRSRSAGRAQLGAAQRSPAGLGAAPRAAGARLGRAAGHGAAAPSAGAPSGAGGAPP